MSARPTHTAFTIAAARRYLAHAMLTHNIDAQVVSVSWLGQRCKQKNGPDHFRIARAVRIR